MKISLRFIPIYLFALFFTHISKANHSLIEEKPRHLFVSHYEHILGTSLEMKFISNSENEAKKAENAALMEINRLSKIFSAYDQESEFNEFQRLGVNKSFKASNELFEIFKLFDFWQKRSNGALNANIGELIEVWNAAAKSQKIPDAKTLNKLILSMQNPVFQINEEEKSITKLREGKLLMNTFVKSYIIQKANEKAKSVADVENVIINSGGDLVVSGIESEYIKVVNPFDIAENAIPISMIQVQNQAVATSGNYYRGLEIDGKWYSHIFDPRNALPVNDIVSATVIAGDASTAGALATAFNILNLEDIENLASNFENIAYLLVGKNGQLYWNANWKKYEIKSEKNEIVEHNKADPKAWDPRYELEISFIFNAISGNSRRPFVAIWVEDSQKKLIKNLALLYNKTKWVPDLRNWYRINGVTFKANKENFASVTGATKSPGKYVIKWDGKNEQGKYVPQGSYTILIETSKEHGTDEFLKQSLVLKKSPVKVSNAGNVEISNVLFDFKKK